MTSYGFMIDLNKSEMGILQSALAHYLTMCKKEIRKGGTVPFLAHKLTIKDLSARLAREIEAIIWKQSLPEDFAPATTRLYDELSRHKVAYAQTGQKWEAVRRAEMIHISGSEMDTLQKALSHYRTVCKQKIAEGAPVPFIVRMMEINWLLSKLDDQIEKLFSRDDLPYVVVAGKRAPKRPDRKRKP